MNKKNIQIKKKSDPSVDGYRLKVLAITETGTIITSGNDIFDYGVIFQHGIQYNSSPLPIDISSSFALSNIFVGRTIRIYVKEITEILGRKVAISTIEISGKNDYDEEVYNNMVVGSTYHLTLFDYNDEFVSSMNSSSITYIESKYDIDKKFMNSGYSKGDNPIVFFHKIKK